MTHFREFAFTVNKILNFFVSCCVFGLSFFKVLEVILNLLELEELNEEVFQGRESDSYKNTYKIFPRSHVLALNTPMTTLETKFGFRFVKERTKVVLLSKK